jgi:hypothetical protein
VKRKSSEDDDGNSSTPVFVCCQLEEKHFNLGGVIFAKDHTGMSVPLCKSSMEKMEMHSN